VPNFDQVRERLIEELDPLHRTEIKGSTDSEHVFRYLLTLWEHDPKRTLMEILRMGLERVIGWCREIDKNKRIGLNVLWTNGEHMAGSRLNRSLWYLERTGLQHCEICGRTHVHHSPKQDYRAVEIASEPITSERWLQIPNGTAFSVDPDFRLNIAPLGDEAIMSAEGVQVLR
jgi:glutamine amidotransferase